ncbi:MAG: 30S ribosomal protein S3ae [Candidatus Thermoplasmatota archaeon]|jgi:small subunit ribosomal protein S3Ae|nr:30S ribosomal protein S3ae [Candidatus Thermoplasmatota archaeon]MCL5786487.1 30S ribosomal protein S3ae [Candidatus Thermoplasmatota archaeon]
MAGEKGQKKVRDKWKEKTWFTVVSPPYLGEKEIALSPASGPEAMVGRKIEVPVSDLTGNFKKAGVKAVFEVTSCQGTKCATEFVGHFVGDDYVRRMVRRRKERMDVVSKSVTKDGVVVSVKAVIVTDTKLTNARKSSIRKNTGSAISEKASSMPMGEFAAYLMGDDLPNAISSVNKDIFPLRKIEIRKSEVLNRSEQHEVPPEVTPVAEPAQ